MVVTTGCARFRPPAASPPIAAVIQDTGFAESSPAPTITIILTVTPLPGATTTSTPTPASTPAPTETSTPIVTPEPTPTATPPPDPAWQINGVPVEAFAVLPPETRVTVREIFVRGQQLGRNPRAFSKLGDSISLTSHYLARYDQKRYDLGIYNALQPTIDYYRRSYDRFGVALRIGLYAWNAFRPGIADPDKCALDEHMVACEFRLQNPSVLLVRLGTNDIAPGDSFERALRYTIEYSVAHGVIPVLSTKSDRFEGDNRHNETMRALAAEYHIPLWDFDLVASTLPDRGLGGDNVHLTMFASNDFSDPRALNFGYPLSDLTALFVLDEIRRTVDPDPLEPAPGHRLAVPGGYD
jgi:hypothetical protein